MADTGYDPPRRDTAFSALQDMIDLAAKRRAQTQEHMEACKAATGDATREHLIATAVLDSLVSVRDKFDGPQAAEAPPMVSGNTRFR